MPTCKKCGHYDIEPSMFEFGLCYKCFRVIYPDIMNLIDEFIEGKLKC